MWLVHRRDWRLCKTSPVNTYFQPPNWPSSQHQMNLVLAAGPFLFGCALRVPCASAKGSLSRLQTYILTQTSSSFQKACSNSTPPSSPAPHVRWCSLLGFFSLVAVRAWLCLCTLCCARLAALCCGVLLFGVFCLRRVCVRALPVCVLWVQSVAVRCALCAPCLCAVLCSVCVCVLCRCV